MPKYKVKIKNKEFNLVDVVEYIRKDLKIHPIIIRYTHTLIESLIEVNTELFNFFENINID